MSPLLRPGKLPPALLRELLAGAPSLPPEVLLGPAIGEDACAIAVPRGTLIAATDPITLTGSEVGRYAVAVNANDVAVMGVRPRWFLASVLLPSGTTEEEVRQLFASMHAALDDAGVALVGGHTEVTEAVTQPVVVGQMLGLSESGVFLRTGAVTPGQLIVQAGEAPVEAAAVLAEEAISSLRALDPVLLQAARRATETPGISVVSAALHATQLGAVALHDPTEGGLAAGLHELADASGVRLVVDPDAVLWFEPGRVICETLGADPWGALASGTLLAAFDADTAEAACRALSEAGTPARVVARAQAGGGVFVSSGSGAPLAHFARDEVARVLERGR